MIGGAGMTSPHAIQLSGGLSVDESTSYSFRWRYPGKRIGWVGALSVWPPARQLPQRGSQVGGGGQSSLLLKRAVRLPGKPTCLSLWERWHGGAVTERASPGISHASIEHPVGKGLCPLPSSGSALLPVDGAPRLPLRGRLFCLERGARSPDRAIPLGAPCSRQPPPSKSKPLKPLRLQGLNCFVFKTFCNIFQAKFPCVVTPPQFQTPLSSSQGPFSPFRS